MKVKTNLRPEELEAVSVGLRELAKGQRKSRDFRPNNDAERKILDEFDSVFGEMLASLESEALKIGDET